jgi:hypothetical protein
LGRLLLCPKIINPAPVTSDNSWQEGCIVWDDLMKHLKEVDTLLLLISCQKSHQARYKTRSKRI